MGPSEFTFSELLCRTQRELTVGYPTVGPCKGDKVSVHSYYYAIPNLLG